MAIGPATMAAFPSWVFNLPERKDPFKKNTIFSERTENAGKKSDWMVSELKIDKRQHAVRAQLEDGHGGQPQAHARNRCRQPLENLAKDILARQMEQLHDQHHHDQHQTGGVKALAAPVPDGHAPQNVHGLARVLGPEKDPGHVDIGKGRQPTDHGPGHSQGAATGRGQAGRRPGRRLGRAGLVDQMGPNELKAALGDRLY